MIIIIMYPTIMNTEYLLLYRNTPTIMLVKHTIEDISSILFKLFVR